MNDSTINKIHFNKYKRYDNQDVEFKPGVTAIAGTNGTCKSSLQVTHTKNAKKIYLIHQMMH